MKTATKKKESGIVRPERRPFLRIEPRSPVRLPQSAKSGLTALEQIIAMLPRRPHSCR